MKWWLCFSVPKPELTINKAIHVCLIIVVLHYQLITMLLGFYPALNAFLVG